MSRRSLWRSGALDGFEWKVAGSNPTTGHLRICFFFKRETLAVANLPAKIHRQSIFKRSFAMISVVESLVVSHRDRTYALRISTNTFTPASS